jgi:hypothetical protein
MAHLVEMSLDDFHGLPQLVVPRTVRMRDSSLTSQNAFDWIFIGYCRKLIEKNEPLSNLLNLHRLDFDDDTFLGNTTKGQRLLLLLAALDGQTQNGGITQFIWNRPEMVLPTLDALETLNYQELLTSYRNIVDRLGIDPNEWTRLRNSNHTDSSKYWDDFVAATQLINGDEFDSPYFDHVGDDALRMAIQ